MRNKIRLDFDTYEWTLASLRNTIRGEILASLRNTIRGEILASLRNTIRGME